MFLLYFLLQFCFIFHYNPVFPFIFLVTYHALVKH